MMDKKIFVFFLSFLICINLFGNSTNGNDIGKNRIISFNFENKDAEKLIKIDDTLKYTHLGFAITTYTLFWALNGVGSALLYYAFTDANSINYDSLKYTHLGLSIVGILSFATMLIIAFTKFAIKMKNKMPIKKTHFVAAFVTLGFYFLELISIILSGVFFGAKLDGANWVGLAHGITCGATTAALTVSLITIFL